MKINDHTRKNVPIVGDVREGEVFSRGHNPPRYYMGVTSSEIHRPGKSIVVNLETGHLLAMDNHLEVSLPNAELVITHAN